MKIRAILTLGGFLLALGLTTQVSAGKYMYKWKSADGEIHYTEQPPQGVEFERIRVAGDKHHGNDAATPVQQQDESKPLQTPEDDKYDSWKQDNCRIAKQNLDVLSNAERIGQDDGKGGTRLMTDEERQASIQKMTEQRDKYCVDGEKDAKK